MTIRKAALAAGVVTLVAMGCVIRTEHKIDARIVVDIRHIEEQAEDVLDFVEGKTDTLPAIEPAGGGTSMIERALEWASPIQVAYAAELKSASPVVTALAKKMKDRFPELEALKSSGCLGEDNRGYTALRDCEATKDAEKKNASQQLSAAENADRKALYKEIAQLNLDANLSVTQVERVYAQKRLERGKTGEIFQLPPAGADFEAFKKSAMGQKLGSDAKPEAWVTLP